MKLPDGRNARGPLIHISTEKKYNSVDIFCGGCAAG